MVHQQKLLEQLEFFEEKVSMYVQNDTILQKINETKEDMARFSLKVLLVGGFSAGKSALINTILGRELLEEEQNPETAIATEIIYGEQEYAELYHDNGTITNCTFEEARLTSPKNCNHITYHVNNQFLKKFPNITLVDMPGYNSGIERHNKAIMQYVNQGNAYVLVVDVEDGGIKSKTIEFLKEIKQYDNNLAIVLTKADKKPDSHVQQVVENVKRTAQQIYQKDIVTVAVSKFDNIEEQMETVLSVYNAENIFEQTFKPRITEIGLLTLSALKKISESYDFDDEGLELEIRNREQAKEQLESQLKEERKKLSKKMKNHVQPSILADIENALYSNSASLAQSVKSGGNAFTRHVNNILRPVLLNSTKKYTEESFNEFIEQLDFSNVFSQQPDEVAEQVTEKFNSFNSSLKKILDSTDDSKNTYRVLSSVLAISTTVVAPWLELIIVFLPDILRLIGVFSEQNQMKDLKQKIDIEIIPQIVAKMSVEIEKSLSELEEGMLGEIAEKINSLIASETAALQSALTLRNTRLEEYQRIQEDTVSDIRSVNEMVDRLQRG